MGATLARVTAPLFTFLGVPVYVSLWFFAIVGWWGYMSRTLTDGLIWGGGITISILVHEYGHALVAKRYQLQPRILLHGWGGLCAHERAEKDRHDAFIIAMGPGAGLILGVAAYVFGKVMVGTPFDTPIARQIVLVMVYVNIFWSFVNLVPVYPLDGGQLFRLAMVRALGGAKGERVTHIVGMGAALIVGGLAYQYMGSMFIMLGGVYLAWKNYEILRDGGGSGVVRPRYEFAHGLLSEAEERLLEEDWAEAARLCHQIRWLENISDEIIGRVWQILTFTSAMMGEHAEALRFAERAPPSGLGELGRAISLEASGRVQEARDTLGRLKRVPSWAKGYAQDLSARL